MGPARKHCGVWYQVDLVLEPPWSNTSRMAHFSPAVPSHNNPTVSNDALTTELY
jgi:hypothetical protein